MLFQGIEKSRSSGEVTSSCLFRQAFGNGATSQRATVEPGSRSGEAKGPSSLGLPHRLPFLSPRVQLSLNPRFVEERRRLSSSPFHL